MALTIALVDWCWHGHHPTYFSHFAEAFTDQGVNVVPFCPEPKDFSERLHKLNPSHYIEDRIAKPVSFDRPRPSSFRPARWRGIYDSLRLFGSLAIKLTAWEIRNGCRINLVFFACMYDIDFFHFPICNYLFRRRWAGLYLSSFAFRATSSITYDFIRSKLCPERFLLNPRLVSIGTLDEGIVDAINAKTGRDVCLHFPDFTDSAGADLATNTIGNKIRMAAQDLPVIVLAGSLYEQRGIALFLQTAMANPQWFFALVGEIKYVSQQTMHLLHNFLHYHPHSFFYSQRILEDSNFNGIIMTSDVVWNIHLDWPGSSNTLTKAATYKKPVVASDRHLLGERVRKYRLGETCDETSVSSVSDAIANILHVSVEDWVVKKQPMWNEYSNLHSLEKLNSTIDAFIRKL